MKSFVFIVAAYLVAHSVFALDVGLTPDKDYIDVQHDGKSIRIQRIQDQGHALTGSFAKTSRSCPPFCIQPLHVAPEVATVGEVEIFEFMENQLRDGSGLLIDARLPSWHQKGTIPGSINIPFTVFEKPASDSELISTFKKLGVTKRQKEPGFVEKMLASGKVSKIWDFSDAKELILWCNGPWCGQSPRAIRALLEHGYPPEKLHYYRDGMQMWQILGLLTVQ
ncbi:rhodanese-like domain-containing protein [Thiohalophilus thiocyanatoxydans]|uniref:Rhodanese-like domain-containing protein n=1 Tax=Thiohalophilus thiocyanatoxydans TaxID=381308 RepID=A0A4R8IU93_9GAMM|nr:rhodanese-like domain-containing protein [Thiohalophilus thiocyanatoxydans]TDY04218.1 rhodanese-like domain-containing protein [Thiohalophilus thiocyanatoxydans]